MSRFSATLDKNAKGITVLTCVVLVIPFFMFIEFFSATSNWTIFIAPVVTVIALVCCFLWRPKEYTLENGELHIRRIASDLIFPVSDIERIEPVDVTEHGSGIRTLGSGGFFGYFGRFWYKKLGSVSMYATDKNKLLVITFSPASGKKPVIISPDDTALFVKTFKNIRNQRATR